MHRVLLTPEVCPLPAFLTGTSTEYLGDRPLPRVVRTRPVLFVLGPDGSGKSLVGRRIVDIPNPIILDNRACQKAILDRVRHGHWAPQLTEAKGVVLDGPVWLQNRPGVVDILTEFLALRVTDGRKTVICQADTGGSVGVLLNHVAAGSCATIALRFPTSRKARLRVAERICAAGGLKSADARRTVGLQEWTYGNVRAALGI